MAVSWLAWKCVKRFSESLLLVVDRVDSHKALKLFRQFIGLEDGLALANRSYLSVQE
jgi:hypothetical protein